MYSKQELIALGMYNACRDDTYYLVGVLYDLVEQNNFVLDGKVKNEFEKQLQTITIPNYSGPISKANSIYQQYMRIFGSITTSIARNSNKITNMHMVVYGIYVDNELVYIGSTINFAHRFS